MIDARSSCTGVFQSDHFQCSQPYHTLHSFTTPSPYPRGPLAVNPRHMHSQHYAQPHATSPHLGYVALPPCPQRPLLPAPVPHVLSASFGHPQPARAPPPPPQVPPRPSAFATAQLLLDVLA